MKDTQKTESEALKAYADCHGNRPFEDTKHERNLNFRASEPVTVPQAVEIMRKACPGGYNAFQAEKLLQLPRGSKVWLAREGSVCVYVQPPVKDKKPLMEADEWHQENNETRIWWD